VAVASGLVVGSISLVGFGIDSLIEVTSGAAVLWRMHMDGGERRERAEQVSLRIVGGCFIALATYIAVDTIKSLYAREQPSRSMPGIVLAIVSLIVMPLLSRSKRRVGKQLRSGLCRPMPPKHNSAHIYLHSCCSELTTNWLLGWWWADSTAALLMVPLIAREGIDGLRAKACC
jgi:divalent metal cation (Fe/Co/Zn/Cd) transporter